MDSNVLWIEYYTQFVHKINSIASCFHENLSNFANWYIWMFFYWYLQEAIKDQQIEFKEINTNHLGSDKEYQIPKSNSGGTSSKSWRLQQWSNVKSGGFPRYLLAY